TRRDGCQVAVAGNVFAVAYIELGAHDAIHYALMINKAARPEFRQGQEAWSADHAAFIIFARRLPTASGYPCHKWESREVVPRQEPLTGQIAVSVKVRILGVAGF